MTLLYLIVFAIWGIVLFKIVRNKIARKHIVAKEVPLQDDSDQKIFFVLGLCILFLGLGFAFYLVFSIYNVLEGEYVESFLQVLDIEYMNELEEQLFDKNREKYLKVRRFNAFYEGFLMGFAALAQYIYWAYSKIEKSCVTEEAVIDGSEYIKLEKIQSFRFQQTIDEGIVKLKIYQNSLLKNEKLAVEILVSQKDENCIRQLFHRYRISE
ncbi:hypothetical protein PRVXT_002306 [Proteinivorax tanatarense]|uniref:DUF5673 domain-containing protein n=1 Tax=Proteinivorax tanatarense TaxID=1260629 RepID=A0AAU7VJI0_9FIRM